MSKVTIKRKNGSQFLRTVERGDMVLIEDEPYLAVWHGMDMVI
ncbi:hypothetical protein [Paenibacillus pini]|nr:hypothetical protein [Paenibacillus pini]